MMKTAVTSYVNAPLGKLCLQREHECTKGDMVNLRKFHLCTTFLNYIFLKLLKVFFAIENIIGTHFSLIYVCKEGA